MRRRAAVLLALFILFGNAASAEWIPLWQNSEKNAVGEGLERVHAWSATWNGFPLLDDGLNAFIKSMLANTTVEYAARIAEEFKYARWDWQLQKTSVLDFSVAIQDEFCFEQSNLLGGQTVAFDKREFSNFANMISQLSKGTITGDVSIFFDLMRLLLPDETATPETLLSVLEKTAEWKTDAIVMEERARPRVTLPGLFGTKAVVHQISRDGLFDLLEDLVARPVENPPEDAPPEEALFDVTLSIKAFLDKVLPIRIQPVDPDHSLESPDTLRTLVNALSNPFEALSGFLPEDMPPIEYREIFCYGQNIAKQLEMQTGSGRFFLEWDNRHENVLLSFQFGNLKANALFTFEEGLPVLERKLQSVTNRSLLEMRLSINGIEATAYRTGAQTFENTGTKETIATKTKWTVESEQLFGGEALTVSFDTLDVTTGAGLQYKRTRETDVALSGLQFDGEPLISIQETITFRKPADGYFEIESALRPGKMAQEALETWLESLRDKTLQVCFTILGRVPSENANYLLELLQAAR